MDEMMPYKGTVKELENEIASLEAHLANLRTELCEAKKRLSNAEYAGLNTIKTLNTGISAFEDACLESRNLAGSQRCMSLALGRRW